MNIESRFGPQDQPEPVSILVVDDHPENLLALEGTLASPGYRVITARSGAEALKKILKEEFALILLDVLMPGIDGFETAKLIRQREVSKNIPIIFLTANATEMSWAHEGYSVGAVDYLIKPLDPDIVRAKVAVFADLFRKTQQIRRQEERIRQAERARSEEVLREREAEYEATFEEAPVGIAHISADTRLVRVNDRFCKKLGYTKDDVQFGLTVHQIVHPKDVEELTAVLREMLAGERMGYQAEARLLHKNGSMIWAAIQISALRDRANRVKKLILVLQNITERIEAEERQRFLAKASEVLLSSLDYRATLASVAQLAVSGLADWCIVEMMPEDQHETPEEVAFAHADSSKVERMKALRNRIPPALDYGLERVRERGQTIVISDLSDPLLEASSPDSETIEAIQALQVVSAIIVPLMVRGQCLGSVALASSSRRYTASDVATAEDLAHRAAFAVDNARLYLDAKNAISLRDEFLSIASHELRTPLTPLQLQFQRLLTTRKEPIESMPPERLRQILQKAERQVFRLTALIDKLLDVSRLTRGPMTINRESVDLVELARDVIARFGEEAGRAGSTLTLSAPSPVVGEWDRLRIEQVVTNLLGNAVKYGNGKPIEVRVDGDSEQARLEVRDQGIGIPAEKLPRIFERFERAVSTRAYGGLGLGLYITRQILDAHEGKISVTSQPDVGSVFTVELPINPGADTFTELTPVTVDSQDSDAPVRVVAAG